MAKQPETALFPYSASHRMQNYTLSDITPEYVNKVLREVRYGRLQYVYELEELMRSTWPRYRQNVNKMTRAISSLEIEIKPGHREGIEEPSEQAIAIHEVVERAFESASPRPGHFELGTTEAIDAILECEAKGPVALEIVWQLQNDIWSPRCFIPFPGKCLSYPVDSRMEDRLMYSTDIAGYGNLKDFAPNTALIGVRAQGGLHPIFTGAMRPLVKYWMAAVFGIGWYIQFVQLYGIPWRTVKTDGTPDAMDKGEEFLANIGSSGTAVTNQDFDLTIHEGVSGNGDNLPQAAIIELANRTCDLLLLGQSLTTDNTGTGSRALGEVHKETLTELEKQRAKWLSDFLSSQLVPAIVRMNFGEIPAEDMPYACVEIPEVEDDKANAERVKVLQEIGVPMSRKWVYETLGVPEPLEGEILFGSSEPDPILPPNAEEEKLDEIIPTEEMAQAAQSALDSNRSLSVFSRPLFGLGATETVRARDISNRTAIDFEQVRRMAEFFDKHAAERVSASWNPDSKIGRRWMAHGGDAGKEWVQSQMEEKVQASATDLKPTKEMADEAKLGLEWRRKFNRGGTEIGVARARDISNRANLSMDTINRMSSYFARHEVDKKALGFSPGEPGYPSAGRIAWALWGGDAGKKWVDSITAK
jgi:phage gp29-like protein